jgi:hypothetical protein
LFSTYQRVGTLIHFFKLLVGFNPLLVMSHSVIDEQSATEVIQAILTKLQRKDEKRK